ncbi:ribulose-phosphate 3-epimerase [Dysgonomonas sp. 25]|uniref:ribulose-phosphate 3-epimerase n=1 Tax=Dysgonomonas sp. 25 TaxID=2302933 RepID=UPI0013D15AF6|nr:ribulose-phosphate 3-epimerase [Dysgonomonas sp. 25]NDV68311.1 ribulose-phosphate 3-epimerase [Dysgonomonas sp. 25]
MSHKIAPSILSADFLNLQRDIEMLNESEADWIHCDVMDGTFVPNISFGFPIIKQVSKIAKKPLDVHLMIVQPEKYINEVRDAGAYLMNVHLEASPHLHRTISAIHDAGMKAGVTLNPHTPVSLLEDIIQDVDLVLIMSVNPGFGGQKFIERSLEKVKMLKRMITERNLSTLIEVDGGINLQTCKQMVDAGADVLVAGNAVFSDADPKGMIHKLKSIE